MAPCALAFAFVALGALLATGACLPNLVSITADDASLDSAPASPCGDGVIATLDDGGDAGESCDPGTDADVNGCSATCRIKCEGRIDPSSGHCYFVAGADSTYQAATTRCKGARAHVVTLSSKDEVDLVATIAADEAGYWVGLSRRPELNEAYGPAGPEEPGFAFPPKGTGPCSGCFGIGADGGIFPSDASDAQCIASRGGSWLQVACNDVTTNRPTVCEREPVGTRAQDCIGGFCFTLPRTAGQKRYLVAVSATDAETAAQSCAGLDGGSLVVLASREEREQLAHEIRARYPDEVEQALWIGLVEDGGAWRWEDGVVADLDAGRPLPWGNAQPASVPGARAYMRLASTAYDTQLAYADGTKTPRAYICQRPAE